MPFAKPLRRAFLITNHAPTQIVSGYENIKPLDTVVAVDAGLEIINRVGLLPAIIIGDLDSIDKDLLDRYSNVPIFRHPTQKNETDTELAISWCIEQDIYNEIVICNDMQGRFDHALAIVQNLLLLHRKQGKKPFIRIESAFQQIFCLPAPHIFHCKPGQLISLIPLSPKVQFKSSTGLKYPLDGLTILQHQSRGISNEFIANEAKIELLNGDVLAVISILVR